MSASRSRPSAWVTGASSGIGEAFAKALAREGHDLVLVARRKERLDALAAALTRQHGIAAHAEPADLTSPADVSRLAEVLAEAPPDLLVNNAGFGTAGRFADLPADRELAEVQLNVVALLALTRAVLPGMVVRGRGAVIQVSSLAGEAPMPFTATYGATKAFVTSFSEALHEELRGTGVRVMAVLPGFTRTEFQEIAGVDPEQIPGPAWMAPEEVVEAALAALARGDARCVPGLTNRVVGLLQGTAPRALVRRIVAATQRSRV